MALFYVAHRLFAAHDRAVGAYVASQLADAAGPESVFLPFCDTDEENLVADCKGRRLFELDCARLRRLSGMIAVLHGPSLDDGVCMEIGFAAAGVPVVLLSTDFQTYAPALGSPCLAFPDPLLEQVATVVVRAHRLGPLRPDMATDRFRAFLEQNLDPVRATTARAVTAMMSTARQEPQAFRRDPARPPLAFIEPSPYLADDMWIAISGALSTRGWQVHTEQRFHARTGTADAARAD